MRTDERNITAVWEGVRRGCSQQKTDPNPEQRDHFVPRYLLFFSRTGAFRSQLSPVGARPGRLRLAACLVISMAPQSAQARFEPCRILRDKDIPCLVWFEDAIAAYGVPTVVFDLYLLVADIGEAARALMAAGWTDAAPLDRLFHFLNGPPPVSHRRFSPPRNSNTIIAEGVRPERYKSGPPTTVLLAAADWKVAVDRLCACSSDGFVPPLSLLVDALIESLLDSPPDTAVSSHLAVHVSYLYGYCAPLKTPDFADYLEVEHRQFHLDALTKPGLGTIPFTEEQRRIRDEIRAGKRQPRRSGWYLPAVSS